MNLNTKILFFPDGASVFTERKVHELFKNATWPSSNMDDNEIVHRSWDGILFRTTCAAEFQQILGPIPFTLVLWILFMVSLAHL